MSLTVWALLGGIGSVIAAIVIAFVTGSRSTSNKRDARDAKAARAADENRRKLDNEIDQDVDLAARARRSGIVRGKRPE